ncbi:MAG: phosphatase family protein [Chitinophagaceae bacterium]|nr:phosphatase family protein [Chitinophagaceae bacterium]
MQTFHKHLLIVLVLLLCSVKSFGQKTDTLIKKLDSLHKEEEKPGQKPIVDVNKDEYTSQTNLTVKAYFVLLGTDMVQEVTGPFHASKKTWIKVGEFGAIEVALFFADKPIQQFASKFMNGNPGLRNTSQYITNFGGAWEGYTLAAFGAYGFIFKSNKVKTTTFLSTQAYIAAGGMSDAVKYITGRQRPNYYDKDHPVPENNHFLGPSVFNGHDPRSGFGSSFPSGHTTAAFSAATVFAFEYKDQILIPVIAYSAATLVGISRVTQNAHWATDVFAGAALGYITGKQVVNNYHRYARLRAGKQKKTALLYNLQYYDGVIMPGVVYKF